MMAACIGIRRVSTHINTKALGLSLNHLFIRHQTTSAAVVGSSLLFPTTPSCRSPLLRKIPTNTTTAAPFLVTPFGLQLQTPPLQLVAQQQQIRSFAGIRKKRKKSSRSKKQQHEDKMKAKEEEMSKRSGLEARAQDLATVAAHHRKWVEFQKSISVDGFETGQLTEVIAGNSRNRKVRAMRMAQRRIRHRIMVRKERMGSAKTGEYTPLEYPPEETARLLAEAAAAIPPRTGLRGTRKRKRHLRRSFLNRLIHRRIKNHRIAAHFRRMKKQSERVRKVLKILREAPEIQKSDRDYQFALFQRWYVNMGLHRRPPNNRTPPRALEEGQPTN
ncbi:hypothetical protein ACA910_014542 [Epithemia clementina (nom. ined.)]